MKITADLLIAAVGCAPSRADLFAPHLDAACRHYGIDTPARLAAFLAQIGHESGAFRWVRELADGGAYEGRADLGNTQPGDGRRYLGRGLLQITGRASYHLMTARMRGQGAPDFEASPDALEEPQWAAWSAADWWDVRGLSALADRGEFDLITRRINGGTNGAADRRQRWERAKAALASAEPAAPAAPTMPAGEAPDWTPPPAQEIPTMAPILAGIGKSIVFNALPAIVQAIPRLGALFATSEQAQKNVKALEVVTQVAADAIGATNAQELVEGLQDRDKAAAARNVVDNNWASILDLVEAGGGGIDGARKADAAVRASGDLKHSASFWIALLLLPLVYLLVLSLIGLLGTATWSDDVRAGLAGSLISAIVGGLVGYYYGQTTSRNRAQPAQ